MSRRVLVISGPSGVGKSTLLARMLVNHPGLQRVTMLATRPPRSGERDGDQFAFVSVSEFRDLVKSGAFAAYRDPYGDDLYGVLHDAVRSVPDHKVPILELDFVNWQSFSESYETVSVLIAAPSVEEMRKRIERRGANTPSEVATRVAISDEVLGHAPLYDFVIINSSLEAAIAQLSGIVVLEELRLGRAGVLAIIEEQVASIRGLRNGGAV